eukprot:1145523-Pelagomonas_calceolata.AAC.1
MPLCDIHVQLHACQGNDKVPCSATGGLTDIFGLHIASSYNKAYMCTYPKLSMLSSKIHLVKPHDWQQLIVMHSFQNAVLCMAPHLVVARACPRRREESSQEHLAICYSKHAIDHIRS